MRAITKLLEVKRIKRAKAPIFIRTDVYRKKKVYTESWRKPKGMHNKQRREFRGNPARVKVGYKNPDEMRGLNLKGMRVVQVNNTAGLMKLNSKEYAVKLGKTGKKLRIELIKLCLQNGFSIINIPDAKSYISKAEAEMKKAKEAKTAEMADKEAKKKKLAEKPKAKKEEEKESEKKTAEAKAAEPKDALKEEKLTEEKATETQKMVTKRL